MRDGHETSQENSRQVGLRIAHLGHLHRNHHSPKPLRGESASTSFGSSELSAYGCRHPLGNHVCPSVFIETEGKASLWQFVSTELTRGDSARTPSPRCYARSKKNPNTAILKGLQIYHNFIRPHESLDGATPAEKAGIVVEGEDKWKTIIQNATHARLKT
jgi:transposase InsO family protein